MNYLLGVYMILYVSLEELCYHELCPKNWKEGDGVRRSWIGIAVLSLCLALGLPVAAAPVPKAPQTPKTLWEAYPDLATTIEINGRMEYLIGYVPTTGEAIYGTDLSIRNMLSGIAQDGSEVKTIADYPALPANISGVIGPNFIPSDPPGGCASPYTSEGRDFRTYGKPGSTANYYYSLTVWWTVDCRNQQVTAQSSSADIQAQCYTGSGKSAEQTLNTSSRRSTGNYTFSSTCLPGFQTLTRWITGTTNGYRITWEGSQASERLN